MPIGKLLTDFCGFTSGHGLPQVGASRTWQIKLLWGFLFIAAFIMFLEQFAEMMIRYFDHPVKVSLEIVSEARYFPAVTICPVNAYNWQTLVAGSGAMKDMMLDFEKYEQNQTTVNVADPYGFAGMGNESDRFRFADRSMFALAKLLSDTDYNGLVAPMIDHLPTATSLAFIQNCTFAGKACVDTDFLTIRDPVYGNCTVFNNGPTYVNTQTGSDYGLKITLVSKQDDLAPNTFTSGAYVTVHKPGDYPFPDAFGHMASVGYRNSFAYQYDRIERMPAPYGSCTEDGSGYSHYYSDWNYNLEACTRSCLQDLITAECGCSDPRFAAAGGATWCTTITQTKCILTWEETQRDDWSLFDDCTCDDICNQTTYTVSVSQADWPTWHYPALDCADPAADYWACLYHKRHDYLEIEVFSDRLEYYMLKEFPAYGWIDVVFSFGGQIGFWIGFSVITCIECLTLPMIIICYLMNRGKVEPTAD